MFVLTVQMGVLVKLPTKDTDPATLKQLDTKITEKKAKQIVGELQRWSVDKQGPRPYPEYRIFLLGGNHLLTALKIVSLQHPHKVKFHKMKVYVFFDIDQLTQLKVCL